MSEPHLPVPAPQWNDHWDPLPARCPQCGGIVDVRPASRADGQWEGYCPTHGTVVTVYPDSPNSEKGDS